MNDNEALKRLLSHQVLWPKNSERLVRVFYDAAKIVAVRQNRLQKKQLKMKEVSSALVLADFVNSQQFHCEASGELAECFGIFEEASAVEYYGKKVMGEVPDAFGRTVLIDEDGMRSLYKEAGTGRHIVDAENYEHNRGKRLPWIRHMILNSESVYVSEETLNGVFRRSFLYTGVVSIPLNPKPKTDHFVVVVRETKNSGYKLVTAYSIQKRNRFLRLVEPTHPLRKS